MTTTQNAESQAGMTPSSALETLLAGNRRFVEARAESRDLRRQIEDTAGGQWPFAAVLGCIDSRVPVEVVFDQGIGDVFSARVAGNVATPEVLGSLEFACKVAGAKLIMVLGHTSCGAVKGACDDVKLGNLSELLARIRPAVASVGAPADAAERTSGNAAFVQDVAEENVRHTLREMRTQSPVLAEMADADEIALVGAMYDVASGEVVLLDG